MDDELRRNDTLPVQHPEALSRPSHKTAKRDSRLVASGLALGSPWLWLSPSSSLFLLLGLVSTWNGCSGRYLVEDHAGLELGHAATGAFTLAWLSAFLTLHWVTCFFARTGQVVNLKPSSLGLRKKEERRRRNPTHLHTRFLLPRKSNLSRRGRGFSVFMERGVRRLQDV